MVTNCVMDADKIIEPESMTAEMRLVILNTGETKFINTIEEYHTLIVEGLIDVR